MTRTPNTEQEWTIHSINIHGIFFERWCQKVIEQTKIWTLDSVNYPVEFPPSNGPFRGKESTLDIRASRDMTDRRVCLLIECKKNNPDFVHWVFFQKPRERANTDFVFSSVANWVKDSITHRWEPEMGSVPSPHDYIVTDEGRETRGNYLDWKKDNKKTKTSNAAILEAAYQVGIATQSVVHEDYVVCQKFNATSLPPPWALKFYMPVILTTARLFTCEFDPNTVDPATGEITLTSASLSERQELVFEYALPRSLQPNPTNLPKAYKEGIIDSFTRLHIVVVQSQQFPNFLQSFDQR